MHTVQLSDASGDHTFDIGHVTRHEDGYRVGIKSAYDTQAHTFVLHEGDWGGFTAVHGADPPVHVSVDSHGTQDDPQRYRAFFPADDGEDVAGHAVDTAAAFTGIGDGFDQRSGAFDSRNASTLAQCASCAYLVIWQLAAAGEPARQLVALGRPAAPAPDDLAIRHQLGCCEGCGCCPGGCCG